MLQLRRHNLAALTSRPVQALLESVPAEGLALERHADLAIATLRSERSRIARQAGWLSRLSTAVDESLRTDATEHMDESDYPERGKLAIARGLDLLNAITGSYRKFFALLEPFVRSINDAGRPARILELASGTGGFSMAIAGLAKSKGLAVEVTGSDIVQLYVDRAARKAALSNNPARFRRIDALDMSELDRDSYDVVFLAQSLHHFTPGELSRILANCRRVATTAFVSVDGFRSVPMVGFVVGTAMLTLWPAMIHDAAISARKFYSEREVELIGRLGAPDAEVTVGRIWPLNTTLTVRFDRR